MMNEAYSNDNSIDGELQIRLMNLVMDEASDFERDQLQLMMEQRPELAAYYSHLEHLHCLLCEAGSGELMMDDEHANAHQNWQLSTDRRRQVLTVLDGVHQTVPSKSVNASSTIKIPTSAWSRWVAAGSMVAAACVLIGLMLLPSNQASRSAARKFSADVTRGNIRRYSMESTSASTLGTSNDGNGSVDSTPNAYYLSDDVDYVPKGYAIPNYRQIPIVGKPDDPSPSAKRDTDGPGNVAWDVTNGEAIKNQLAPDFGSWQDPAPSGTPNLSFESSGATSAKDFAERYGSMDRSSQIAAGERVVEQSVTVTGQVSVPDGGSILLGGIRRSRDLKTESGSTQSTWMMDVTPRLIIPEEEEELLGIVRAAGETQLSELQQLEKRERLQDATRSIDELTIRLESRLNSAGTKELAIREQNESLREDYFAYDRRLKDSDLDRTTELKALADQSLTLGLPVTPTPNTEKASKRRDRVELSGKATVPKQAEAMEEQSASADAFSTFSLNVSDVSFKLAQSALSQGQWPETTKIRIEDFVNAIDYHDPLPNTNQNVACRIEQAIHPFLMQRNLMRVSMRTAATGRSQNTPLRLTLLLDNSGSMERPDRRQAVLRTFQALTLQLSAADQVTLISFASSPRLLADKVSGNQGERLLQLIENLPSEGGTNIEAALLLAQEKAAEQQLAGAQNRIVLFTDGAVNLGDANAESLSKLVMQMRNNGIAFDAAGISALDLNDEVLEALTRQGDGRYYVLDSAEAASQSFAAQIAGALRPSAQNVKVQVEFNPQRVDRYKLLGFEKHRLNKEDFRNDQVDAAELAAAEAGVAVYQFEIKPKGSGDVGSVSVRFLDVSTNQMVERRWPIPYEPNAPRLEQAAASMQLAASAALLAVKLSGGPLADNVDLAQLQKLLSTLPDQCIHQPRVQQLRTMIDQANAMGDKE